MNSDMNSTTSLRPLPLRPIPTSAKVQRVVERVRALREYTRTTGYHTTRSQNAALQELDGIELADALVVLGKE
jgi:hypothetical protein